LTQVMVLCVYSLSRKAQSMKRRIRRVSWKCSFLSPRPAFCVSKYFFTIHNLHKLPSASRQSQFFSNPALVSHLLQYLRPETAHPLFILGSLVSDTDPLKLQVLNAALRSYDTRRKIPQDGARL